MNAKQSPQLKGEDKLRKELAQAWKDIESLPITEIAARNPGVLEYCKHWEDRAIAAESRIERQDTAIRQLREALEDLERVSGLASMWDDEGRKAARAALAATEGLTDGIV